MSATSLGQEGLIALMVLVGVLFVGTLVLSTYAVVMRSVHVAQERETRERTERWRDPADIGIAMGIRGTDVARGAADIVLTDDNFASIVEAVEEGRRQYANIRKFVAYLACTNFGEVMAVFANVVSGAPLVLLPIQILWVNLVTDSATALSLGLEPAERNLMKERPRKVGQGILDRQLLVALCIIGTYIGGATLALYHWYLAGAQSGHANSMAFTSLVVLSTVSVVNFRSLQSPLSEIDWRSNQWLLIAILLMLSMQVLGLYWPPLQTALHTRPLGGSDWIILLLIVLPVIMLGEFYKMIKRRAQ